MAPIYLFVIGAILLIVEMMIPGFGILGGMGILSLVIGIILYASEFIHGYLVLGITFIGVLATLLFIYRLFKRKGALNKMILRAEQRNESGYIAGVDRHDLEGKTGIALTPLRPAGTMEIAGEPIDVVTEGGYIEKGKIVEVVRTEGSRVIVRAMKEEKGV
jgi:membrane-bound serine protease (ClpP class)